MYTDISFSESKEFTPNDSLCSVNDHSNTKKNESTYISDPYISDVFYTPDCCLNPKFEFIPRPTIISDISTDLQPLSTHIDPLFSRDATEFICNLNPQDSSFVTGASTTQSCKVSLLSIPISATSADNFDLDSSHLSQNKILPQESESSDVSFHRPMGLDSPSHIRRYLRTPTDYVLRCNLCSNTYRSKNRYENHLSRHYTGRNIWGCKSCDFTFHSINGLKLHTDYTHNCKPLRRSKRNNRMMSTNTGLPNKVKHSPQKTNGLTLHLFVFCGECHFYSFTTHHGLLYYTAI